MTAVALETVFLRFCQGIGREEKWGERRRRIDLWSRLRIETSNLGSTNNFWTVTTIGEVNIR